MSENLNIPARWVMGASGAYLYAGDWCMASVKRDKRGIYHIDLMARDMGNYNSLKEGQEELIRILSRSPSQSPSKVTDSEPVNISDLENKVKKLDDEIYGIKCDISDIYRRICI